MIWVDSIRYDTIRYDSIRFDSILYDLIWYSTIWFNTIRFDSISEQLFLCNLKGKIIKETMQNNMLRYNSMQYDTIRYNTIWYDTMRFNTIWYDTIRFDTANCSLKVIINVSIRLFLKDKHFRLYTYIYFKWGDNELPSENFQKWRLIEIIKPV